MFQNSIQYKQIEEYLYIFVIGTFLFNILTLGCEQYKTFQTCPKFRGAL